MPKSINCGVKSVTENCNFLLDLVSSQISQGVHRSAKYQQEPSSTDDIVHFENHWAQIVE